MKIIELLNKIANGEEMPKKIMYDGYTYQFDNKCENYVRDNDMGVSINWDYVAINCLNEPVEILDEPKKINKIRIDYNSINIDKVFETGTTTFFREKDIEIFQCLSSKINELIDEVNKLKESDK